MSVPVPGERQPDPHDLEARYLQAIDDVARWKRLTRGTNELLARLVGTSSQSNISRFLSRTPGYEPRPSRPEMMKILGGIETICHLETGVPSPAMGPTEEHGASDATDDYEYYCAYVLRSRTLRRDPDIERSLSSARDLCVQAVYGPPAYRPYMAWSLLLTFAARVDGPLRKVVDRRLLEATGRRARRLVNVVFQSVVGRRGDAGDVAGGIGGGRASVGEVVGGVAGGGGDVAAVTGDKAGGRGNAGEVTGDTAGGRGDVGEVTGGIASSRADACAAGQASDFRGRGGRSRSGGVPGGAPAGEPLAAFGVVMVRLGRHLDHQAWVEDGARYLVDAVRFAGADERIWRDVLRALGDLLEQGFEGAEDWARQLGEAVAELPAAERRRLLRRLRVDGALSPWSDWLSPNTPES